MSRPELNELYKHQKKAKDKALEHSDETGTFIIPTGGGKTYVQIDTVHEKANKTGGKVFVVLEPRINLAIQQTNEFYERLSAHGDKPFRYMCVHSGRMSSDHLVEKAKENQWGEVDHHHFNATTSSMEILREFNKALQEGENFLVVGTYHSADRILQGLQAHGPDHVICDECHYLTRTDFQNRHQFFNCPYHHYTATARHTPSDEGLGMNNEDRFGEVLHQTPVKTLVERGIIVEPRLVWVNGDSTNESLREDYFASLLEIWDHQQEECDYPPKLLINATGTDQLHNLAHRAVNHEAFEDATVYHISSDSGNNSDIRGEWINGQEVTRRKWVKEVKREEGECLVFHYDIVSEGIDVPGISGSAFFRSSNRDAKIMQIMGRTMRILEEDRGKPIKDRKKQNSWIYVPMVTGMENQDLMSMRENLVNIVEPMMKMGLNPTEDAVIRNPTGTGDEEDDELFDLLETENQLELENIETPVDFLEHVEIHVSEKFVEDELSKMKEGLQERKSIEGKLDFFKQTINQ